MESCHGSYASGSYRRSGGGCIAAWKCSRLGPSGKRWLPPVVRPSAVTPHVVAPADPAGAPPVGAVKKQVGHQRRQGRAQLHRSGHVRGEGRPACGPATGAGYVRATAPPAPRHLGCLGFTTATKPATTSWPTSQAVGLGRNASVRRSAPRSANQPCAWNSGTIHRTGATHRSEAPGNETRYHGETLRELHFEDALHSMRVPDLTTGAGGSAICRGWIQGMNDPFCTMESAMQPTGLSSTEPVA